MPDKRITSPDLPDVCSVSQMAQLLGLSRSRFYQLLKQGVFPLPLYDLASKRPFYPQRLQKQCLAIREGGVGVNGRRILFYHRRKKKGSPASKRAVAPRYQVLLRALQQMGFRTTPRQLRAALQELYPEGVPPHQDDGLILRDLLSYGTRSLSQ